MAKAKPQEKGVLTELQKYGIVISAYEKEFKKWETRGDKIVKRYRDEERKANDKQARFNILWSNVNTLVPATYSRIPQPDVSRRFRDNDQTGRVASLILERGLEFEVQHYSDYRSAMKQCVFDRFTCGRGTAWARYEPHFRAMQEPEDGVEITEDVDKPQEELDYECAPVDYVHWKDFGHNVARTWEEVWCVWRRVYMQMPAKVERFGEALAKKIPQDAKPKDGRATDTAGGDNDDGSWIFELWDKNKKRAFWFHKGMKDFLDQRDDPLGLQDFFPCPRPLYATMTNETLVPVPDFTQYQDQARTLDTLEDRIEGLSDMLKVVGVYDSSAGTAIGRLFTEGSNGTLIAVKNWAAFAEKNGLKGAIEQLELKSVAEALEAAYRAKAEVKNSVYEITHISDIMRGQVDPNEKLGQSQLKSQYGNLGLRSYQEEVARFATELLQLKAQIMCGKFDPQTLLKISSVEQLSTVDQQQVQPALALLVGEERMLDPEANPINPMRSFRIEVAADTLVQINEQAVKEERNEFLKANGEFLDATTKIMQQAGPAAQALVKPLMEMWKFGVAGYKAGKTMEGAIDQAADQLQQILSQPPQPPQPDPAAQAKAQADMVKAQAEAQTAPIRAQAEQARAQADVLVANADLQKAKVQAMTPQPLQVVNG